MKPFILLYIDDAEADAMLLRSLMTLHDIEVEEARSGARGLAAYTPERHRAVVIDWNLPDMQGLDVGKALLARYPECQVGLISGTLEKEHISAAAAHGIHHCFEKTMDMAHVHHIEQFVRG